MRGANVVHLVGNLGQDPELRSTQSGKRVAHLSLCTEHRQGQVQWHDLVAWDAAAEILARHAGKGSRLYVQGHISYRLFQDKAGSNHRRAEIVVDEFVFLDAPKAADGGGA